jgi:membrane protease YdiL (CAAX protease family)
MENSFHNKKIILVFIICQIILALFAIYNDLIVNTFSQNGIEEFKSFQEKIILVLVVAPLFETLIFNLLLNEVFFKLTSKIIYCIILSSFFFSLIHYYSLTYVSFTFLAGLTFNGFYFWIRKDKGYKVAVLSVFLLHFNHNLIGVMLGK